MKISDRAKQMMMHHEGVRFKPYLCPAHIWTVGVGSVLHHEQIKLPMARTGDYTGQIRKEFPLAAEHQRVWSKEEVMDLFERDLVRFERGALRLSPNLDGRQGAFDAVVSFCFNAGLGNYQRSTIRMKNNRGDYEGAAEAFMMWTKGGGRVLPGLVKRRRDEAALFLE
jgi:lysozyme